MDPNANLAEQLRLSAAIADNEWLDGSELRVLACRLSELVQDLNGWIERGGFLPTAWYPNEEPREPSRGHNRGGI